MGPDTPQREETVTQETLDLSLGIFTLGLPPSLYPDWHNPYGPDPRIFAMCHGHEGMRQSCDQRDINLRLSWRKGSYLPAVGGE